MRVNVKLRICVVQLNGQIGRFAETKQRAWQILEQYKGRKPDLIVFPEFALTGYSFHNRAHILPYTSKVGTGPSFEFAQEVSKRFSCYTVMGYPERSEEKSGFTNLYNSAVMTNPEGKVVMNYRKSFNYFTDDDWGCKENPEGFSGFELPVKGTDIDTGKETIVHLRTSMGICMDLSNYKFEAPFTDYEFSSFNLDRGSELVICPMAWLHSKSITRDSKDPKAEWADIKKTLDEQGLPEHGSQGKFEINVDLGRNVPKVPYEEAMTEGTYSKGNEPDISNITFWLLRFTPYVALKTRYEWFKRALLVPKLLTLKEGSSYVGCSLTKPWVQEGKETILVLANRCGIEDKTTVYAGSSGIYKFNGRYSGEDSVDTTNSSIELYGNLSKAYEGILVRDVDFEVDRT